MKQHPCAVPSTTCAERRPANTLPASAASCSLTVSEGLPAFACDLTAAAHSCSNDSWPGSLILV